MARGGGRLTGSEFFRAIDDLGRRIPLVKLERIEELYPEFQENSRKSVVLSSPPKIQEKKDSHGYTRKLGRKSPRKPETSMLTSSEPPKKQYKLKEETVKKGIDKIIESPNSSPKSTVVIVECDPNALLTLSESDKSTLSLSEGSELCLSQEIYSDSNTSELYSQPQRNEISTKVNTPALWESGNTRVETMSFSGNSGLGANSQTYPETTRRSDSQISENISVRLNPATSTRPTYSGRSESQVNQLSYSNSNINSQMYSGISRSHANSRIYESRESGLNNPTIYSESGASVYSGNSGPSVNSQVYSASSVNSASYSGYNRAALNPPGNNVLSVNTPGYSGNIKSDINTGYSRNNESLNYSGNVRSEMLQPVYYGNNSHELNSQNFSGNNQSRVVAGFSGSSGHCINSQNYSESNTASYSNNSGHAVNSLNYGNKGSAINSEPFSGNRLGVNAQTYVSNSGSSASYTAYGGSAGSSVNSSYSGSGGNGMTTFAGSGGSGINTSAYSGNSASSTCRDMRFSGGSSYSGSENTPQYAVLQNYCGSSESNIDNADQPGWHME